MALCGSTEMNREHGIDFVRLSGWRRDGAWRIRKFRSAFAARKWAAEQGFPFEEEPSMMEITDSQPGPPQEADVARRNIEWVRVSQLRFKEGYHARLSEPHPMKRNRDGEMLGTRERTWSFGEAVGQGRCPGFITDPEENRRRLPEARKQAWPAHEAERWMAGWMHADGICATRGLSAAKSADPSRAKRTKRAVIAVQEEHSPEFVLSKEEVRKRKLAARRHAHVDAGEQK